MNAILENNPVQTQTPVRAEQKQQLTDAPVEWTSIRPEDLSVKAHADILYVDEQLQIVEIMTTYFRRHGLTVITASSADVAMRLADEWQVEVMVVNADISGNSGIQLIRYLRANNPTTPIVLRTASGQLPPEENSAARPGATCCVSKTESLAGVLATVLSVRSN